MLYRLKDIAQAMDCCERTAKRWWKKLDVPPNITGHGPHRWKPRRFKLLLRLWEAYCTRYGTTPQIMIQKHAGRYTDGAQLEFSLPLTREEKNRRKEKSKFLNPNAISTDGLPRRKNI
jgi:hypothetical protein